MTEYVKFPSSEAEWQQISDEFLSDWDLPHVLGAIDGEQLMKIQRISWCYFEKRKKVEYKRCFARILFAM